MNTRDRGGPRPGTEPAGLSPVRAFFLICALATILGGAVFATRDAAPSEPPAPARSPDYSLTDEEAIAEFERLRANAFDSVRTRSLSLIDEVATPGGPLHQHATREIRTLLREGIHDRSRFQSLDKDVVRNSNGEIVIVEIGRLSPCFVNERGADVTSGPSVIHQSARWTLRLVDGTWLVHEALVLRDRVIRAEGASCA